MVTRERTASAGAACELNPQPNHHIIILIMMTVIIVVIVTIVINICRQHLLYPSPVWNENLYGIIHSIFPLHPT